MPGRRRAVAALSRATARIEQTGCHVKNDINASATAADSASTAAANKVNELSATYGLDPDLIAKITQDDKLSPDLRDDLAQEFENGEAAAYHAQHGEFDGEEGGKQDGPSKRKLPSSEELLDVGSRIAELLNSKSLTAKRLGHLMKSSSGSWNANTWRLAKLRASQFADEMDAKDVYRIIVSCGLSGELNLSFAEILAVQLTRMLSLPNADNRSSAGQKHQSMEAGDKRVPTVVGGHRFNCRELADLCELLGALVNGKSPDAIRSRIDAIGGSTYGGVGSSECDTGKTSRINQQACLPILAVISSAFAGRVVEASGGDLARVLDAFAQASISDNLVLSRIAAVVMIKTPFYTHSELVSMLKSMARLGFRHESLFLKVATTRFSGNPQISVDELIDLAFAYARFQLVIPVLTDGILKNNYVEVVQSFPVPNDDFSDKNYAEFFSRLPRLLEFFVSCHELEVSFFPELVSLLQDSLYFSLSNDTWTVTPLLFWRSLVALSEGGCFGSHDFDDIIEDEDDSDDSNAAVRPESALLYFAKRYARKHEIVSCFPKGTSWEDGSDILVGPEDHLFADCLPSLFRVVGEWSSSLGNNIRNRLDSYEGLSGTVKLATYLLKQTIEHDIPRDVAQFGATKSIDSGCSLGSKIQKHIGLVDVCYIAKGIRALPPTMATETLEFLKPHIEYHLRQYGTGRQQGIYYESLVLSVKILGIQFSNDAEDSVSPEEIVENVAKSCHNDKLKRLCFPHWFVESNRQNIFECDDTILPDHTVLPAHLRELLQFTEGSGSGSDEGSTKKWSLVKVLLPYQIAVTDNDTTTTKLLLGPKSLVCNELSYETKAWMGVYDIRAHMTYNEFWRMNRKRKKRVVSQI